MISEIKLFFTKATVLKEPISSFAPILIGLRQLTQRRFFWVKLAVLALHEAPSIEMLYSHEAGILIKEQKHGFTQDFLFSFVRRTMAAQPMRWQNLWI